MGERMLRKWYGPAIAVAVAAVLVTGACTAPAQVCKLSTFQPKPSVPLVGSAPSGPVSDECPGRRCRPGTIQPSSSSAAMCPAVVAAANGLATPAQTRPGLDLALIPGRPISGQACRYHTDNSGDFIREARPAVLDPTEVDNLTDLLNDGNIIPAGVAYSCGSEPIESEVKYLIHLAYATGPNVEVAVDSWACRWAYNGLVAASTTPKLWDVLISVPG